MNRIADPISRLARAYSRTNADECRKLWRFGRLALQKLLPDLRTPHLSRALLIIPFLFAPATASSQAEKVGSWLVMTTVDRMTDEKGTFASTYNLVAGADDPWQLQIFCLLDFPSVAITTKGFWGAYLPHLSKVEYRIDKGTPVSGTWFISTNGKSAHVNSKSLLDVLQKGSKVLFHVVDYQLKSHYGEFSLDGADRAIGQIASTCKKPVTKKPTKSVAPAK
jgi:hypothetical protein